MARMNPAARFAALILFGALTALPRWSAAQPADADPKASGDAAVEARTRYGRGIKLYGDGDFKLALIEFTRAYELAPSFRILYNIGQVNLQLNNYAAARRAFEKYLEEGGKKIPPRQVQAVEKELASLRARTATLTITSNVDGAQVLLNGVPVATTPVKEPLLVDAGQHTVRIEMGGRTPASRFVTLAGGDDTKLELPLEAPPPPAALAPVVAPEPLPRATRAPDAPAKPETSYVWVGWVATGVLAAGTAATGVAAIASMNDLEELKKSATTGDDLASAQSKARALSITADVLGAATIVTGGVTLYFTLRGPSSARSPSTTAGIGVGPGKMTFSGAF
jgi:hypothetical protein